MSCDSVSSDSSVLEIEPDVPKIGQLEFGVEYDRYLFLINRFEKKLNWSVTCEPSNNNYPKKASALWNFYCSRMKCKGLTKLKCFHDKVPNQKNTWKWLSHFRSGKTSVISCYQWLSYFALENFPNFRSLDLCREVSELIISVIQAKDLETNPVTNTVDSYVKLWVSPSSEGKRQTKVSAHTKKKQQEYSKCTCKCNCTISFAEILIFKSLENKTFIHVSVVYCLGLIIPLRLLNFFQEHKNCLPGQIFEMKYGLKKPNVQQKQLTCDCRAVLILLQTYIDLYRKGKWSYIF